MVVETGAVQENGATVAPTVATTPREDGAEPPLPRPVRRTRRLVWLSVAATTLVGAAWTAVATSMVENARTRLEALVDRAQGGEIIRDLQAQLVKKEADTNALLDQKDKEYQDLLNNAGFAVTAYVPMFFRDLPYCINELKNWARENGYAFTVEGDPNQYVLRVSYFRSQLQVRCAGSPFGDAVYVILSGTAPNTQDVNGAYRELSTRLARYSVYPQVAATAGGGWLFNGPAFVSGYVTFELSYSDYKMWEQNTFPPQIKTAFGISGSLARNYMVDNYAFMTVDEPGRSTTIRSPDLNAYKLQAADGSWVAPATLLAEGTVPGAETKVRTDVFVTVGGMYYGQEDAYSLTSRFLGTDAQERLSTLPGIVDGGKLRVVMRSR